MPEPVNVRDACDDMPTRVFFILKFSSYATISIYPNFSSSVVRRALRAGEFSGTGPFHIVESCREVRSTVFFGRSFAMMANACSKLKCFRAAPIRRHRARAINPPKRSSVASGMPLQSVT